MKTAVCPGSYDPVTIGHMDVIRRTAGLFDRVVVTVLVNREKTPRFSLEERVAMLEKCVAGIPGVSVDVYEGLLADYVQKIGAAAVVKGVRDFMDYAMETRMAQINRKIGAQPVETLLLPARAELLHVSSSTVWQIARAGGEIKDYIPPQIWVEIEKRLAETEESK
ncbi:pantetheine-phosphate adenylyltransferase [Feifania hominis]|uniref:Phosphopantetheine adenylyltransferase n=1 Tax=Feifania hominis TaxID=2763660 RepID=A0A926DC97_9FIRM|nr:pantetheine-phosphate adenylyltransferase [Feifania hominis]MBC8535179.1 pantetheine-phosphate adenylyltransferase [Feifania hominis]